MKWGVATLNVVFFLARRYILCTNGTKSQTAHCRAAAAAATAIGASLTNVCVAEDSKAFKMGIYAPPGGGKGTVCKKLVEEYGLVQVSTGDLLRDIAKGNTDLG